MKYSGAVLIILCLAWGCGQVTTTSTENTSPTSQTEGSLPGMEQFILTTLEEALSPCVDYSHPSSFRAIVTYNSQIRDISEDASSFLSFSSFMSSNESLSEYRYETSVREGSKNYWIPIREDQMNELFSLPDEESIEVYLRTIGRNTVGDYRVYVVMEAFREI